MSSTSTESIVKRTSSAGIIATLLHTQSFSERMARHGILTPQLPSRQMHGWEGINLFVVR